MQQWDDSGTTNFGLGLLFFKEEESRTPTFKILVRTLRLCLAHKLHEQITEIFENLAKNTTIKKSTIMF